MSGSTYKREEEKRLVPKKANVKEFLGWSWVPKQQALELVSGLEGKTADEIAKMMKSVKVGNRTYSAGEVLKSLRDNAPNIKHASYMLVADKEGNVTMHLYFEANRYAIKKQAAGGDEGAQLLAGLAEGRPEGTVIATAIVKEDRMFAFSKKDDLCGKKPLKWDV